MPPHHHHGGGGRRRGGRRFFGGGYGPVYDDGDDYTEILVLGDPRLYDPTLRRATDLDRAVRQASGLDAGDILPTFVTPTDATNYIQEVDTGYARLDASITQSTVADTFRAQWAAQLAAWKVFASGARSSVGWLNTTAIMQQTDRWAQQLKDWDANFQAQGGKDVGPAPLPPGQGMPSGSGVTIPDLTNLALAVGAVAAVVFIAPKLFR